MAERAYGDSGDTVSDVFGVNVFEPNVYPDGFAWGAAGASKPADFAPP